MCLSVELGRDELDSGQPAVCEVGPVHGACQPLGGWLIEEAMRRRRLIVRGPPSHMVGFGGAQQVDLRGPR